MGDRKIPAIEYFLRLFFPPRCVCCDTILPVYAPEELCDDCENSLPVLGSCVFANPAGKSVGAVYSVFDYEGGIREAIHRLKFNDRPGNASVLIRLSHHLLESVLCAETPLFNQPPKYDIIIPVPIHFLRKRQRGYNQSRLLAYSLARRMRIPVMENVLVKAFNTPPQSTLGKGSRYENLKGAFLVKKKERVSGLRILLVDDVMTTGSTLEQCGKALMAAGAAQVDAYVVAIRRKLISPN